MLRHRSLRINHFLYREQDLRVSREGPVFSTGAALQLTDDMADLILQRKDLITEIAGRFNAAINRRSFDQRCFQVFAQLIELICQCRDVAQQ